MNIKDKITRYVIASHFMGSIFNGDDTNLTDNESTRLNDFLVKVSENDGRGHWVMPFNQEPEFLPCEVCDLYADCYVLEYMNMD